MDYLRELYLSHMSLGDLLRRMGRLEEATDYYYRSLDLRNQLVSADPDRIDYRR